MRRMTLLFSLFLITWLVPNPAHAFTAVEADGLQVDVTGLVRATLLGTGVHLAPHLDADVYGLYALRAGAKVRIGDRLRLGGQYEVANGGHRLLDAYGEVALGTNGRLRAGRFKTPVSKEFLLPYGDMVFLERALLVDLARRRANGVMVTEVVDLDGQGAEFSLGLFDGGGSLESIGDDPFLVARGLWHGPAGVDVHVGLAQDLGTTERPSGQQGDLAVIAHRGPWVGHGEVLVTRGQDGEVNGGSEVSLEHIFEAHGYRPGLELEAAYELLQTESQWTQRVITALDVAWHHHQVVGRVQYALTQDTEQLAHGVGVELQMQI